MTVYEEDSFIETDSKYHSGIKLDEYQGRYSLTNAFMSKDGKVGIKQCFTIKDGAANKKIGWQVFLGDRDESIEMLRTFLKMLGAEPEGPMEIPEPASTAGDGFDDDQIPF